MYIQETQPQEQRKLTKQRIIIKLQSSVNYFIFNCIVGTKKKKKRRAENSVEPDEQDNKNETQCREITSLRCYAPTCIPVHYFVQAVHGLLIHFRCAATSVLASSLAFSSAIYLVFTAAWKVSLQPRNRSRVTLSDWKPARRNSRPAVPIECPRTCSPELREKPGCVDWREFLRIRISFSRRKRATTERATRVAQGWSQPVEREHWTRREIARGTEVPRYGRIFFFFKIDGRGNQM